MSEQHVELFLKWKANADSHKVRDWLTQRGIGFKEMPKEPGVVVLASKRLLDQHLEISLDDIRPPAEIPVPKELESDVASIILPSPRRIRA
jgi:hypothetical protein